MVYGHLIRKNEKFQKTLDFFFVSGKSIIIATHTSGFSYANISKRANIFHESTALIIFYNL